MKVRAVLLITLFAAADLFAARPEPQKQIEAFLQSVTQKGATVALDDLCKGTALGAQKHNELTAYAPQMDALFKAYGKIARTEIVERKQISESLVRFRLISFSEQSVPLFWEFLFLKAKDEWQVYSFRVNENMYKVFNENPS